MSIRLEVDQSAYEDYFTAEAEDLIVNIDFITAGAVTENDIFKPVPLSARIAATGVEGVQTLALD